MTSLQLISYIALWIIVVVQGVLILALARQIGLLHERFASGGARIMNMGLNIGDQAPALDEYDVNSHKVTMGTELNKRTLLMFISTGCSTCASLIPHLKSLARNEHDNTEIKVIAFGTTPEAGKKYAVEHSLDSIIPVIVSNDLALSYKVTLAPYGIVVDRAGVVRAKGLVNSYFDIESLLNAEEMGVRSIQEYLGVGEE